MLRPISPTSLEHLLEAAHGADCDLDLALLRIGVYAPADLSELRSTLTASGVRLTSSTNPDGHRVVVVSEADREIAQITHDGVVQPVNDCGPGQQVSHPAIA